MGIEDLPQSEETRAFRAFDAVLREDEAIVAAGIRVMSWTGDRADNMKPSTGMMPMIRITPVARPDSSHFELSKVIVLGIEVEAYVATFNRDHILNLWGAIRKAFRKDKPFRGTTVSCFLAQEGGVAMSDVEKPAIGSGPDDDPYQGALGSFALKAIVSR